MQKCITVLIVFTIISKPSSAILKGVKDCKGI